MSDKEFGGADDLSLPKATVQKIINEVLASPSITGTSDPSTKSSGSPSFTKESRDLLIECCIEFLTMLSSESNEIAEKDAKKTISESHISKALRELGFGEYCEELGRVAEGFKTSQGMRERKEKGKIEKSGMSQEELVRAQEELFRSAGEKFGSVASPGAD